MFLKEWRKRKQLAKWKAGKVENQLPTIQEESGNETETNSGKLKRKKLGIEIKTGIDKKQIDQ